MLAVSSLHYGPADNSATLIISCFIKIQIGLTFLMPAFPRCRRKQAVKCTCLLLVSCYFGVFVSDCPVLLFLCWATVLKQLWFTSGENRESQDGLRKALGDQFSKASRDQNFIKTTMAKTFAITRHSIVSDPVPISVLDFGCSSGQHYLPQQWLAAFDLQFMLPLFQLVTVNCWCCVQNVFVPTD